MLEMSEIMLEMSEIKLRPYQINYLFIIPSLSNFWPKAIKLFIFCACVRCALIRIKMCTN